MSLGVILIVMIAFTITYIPFACYIECIMPGEFGIPLPFYFPFQPSYWKFCKKTTYETSSDKNLEFKNRLKPKLKEFICLNNISKVKHIKLKLQ
jgi:hypothetical protein